MKYELKSASYEATPAAMVLRGVPILAEDTFPTADRSSIDLKALSVQGVTTREATVRKAEKYAGMRIRECLNEVKRGNVNALGDLVRENPAYILAPQVRKEFFRLVKAGRFRVSRGRPPEQYIVHPLVMASLVAGCVEHGCAENEHQAFNQISEWLGYVSSDRVKALYYQAHKEKRFSAILIQDKYSSQYIDDKEMEAVLRNAISLPPGGRVIQSVGDAQLGEINIILESR